MGDRLGGFYPFLWKAYFLKIVFDFENSKDIAFFILSEDGSMWNRIGQDLQIKYTIRWIYLLAIVSEYTIIVKKAGGYADFRNFIYNTESVT